MLSFNKLALFTNRFAARTKGKIAYAFTTVSGFGSKYANPSTGFTTFVDTARFNIAGNAISVGWRDTPYIHVYAWSSGFGSKYADPATLPTGSVGKTGWHPSGTEVISKVGANIAVYAWSSGFGTKYSDHTSLSTDYSFINECGFNPTGTAIGFGSQNATKFTGALAFTSGTGFGSLYSDAASMPTTAGHGFAFGPKP
jgi:hypothetical protein